MSAKYVMETQHSALASLLAPDPHLVLFSNDLHGAVEVGAIYFRAYRLERLQCLGSRVAELVSRAH